MAEIAVQVKSVRITPRKMGLIADQVRGRRVVDALMYLRLSPRKRTAGIFYELLKSALANADRKGTIDMDALVVQTVLVGPGTTLKRLMPRAKGSASRILKRTSHVSLVLRECW